jgi:hypothetical protein
MNVKVVRYNFFRQERGPILRFTEHSPACEEHDHQICNCTKNVKERPEGVPSSVNQNILLENKDNELIKSFSGITAEFSLSSLETTFRWELDEAIKDGLCEDSPVTKKAQAYFYFNRNEINNHISVTITLPGYGNVDCFFGHVFFGNDVDTSRLMNGHAPSRIIDLSKIKPNQIWVHDCNWGGEAVEFLKENEEFNLWWEIKNKVDNIKKMSEPFVNDKDISVDELRLRVEFNKELLTEVEAVIEKYKIILLNLKNTELFRCSDLVSKKADEEGKRLSEERNRQDEEYAKNSKEKTECNS